MVRGGTVITIRGKGFLNNAISVKFTSIDGKTILDGICPSFTTSKVIEVTAPDLSTLCNSQGNKNWAYVTVTCMDADGTTRIKAKGRRKFKYTEKCKIVSIFIIIIIQDKTFFFFWIKKN
jgi:phage tail sheath gpL-like